MFKGISKRWLINTFGVVSAIVVLLIIFISVAVHSLCYSTVENELLNQTKLKILRSLQEKEASQK